ncbi:MAG: cell division FtsA domain-containing protein [Patescibacteria group bacterium]|nr:cell division FtsA domain-containing protein [Patescibacteria group bacterium]
MARRNKSKDDYFISLDIGSEAVKALILRVDKKQEKAFIIGVGQECQKQSNIQGSSINDVAGVVFACKKAIDSAVAMAKTRPTKVIIGMGGEFIKTMTVEVNYIRKNFRSKIDTKEIKDVVCQAKLDSSKEIAKRMTEEDGRNSDIKIASAVIADVCIDGYMVMSPVGFRGTEIELRIFNSILSEKNLKIIKGIAKKLNLNIINIIAEPYAVAMSIGIKEIIKFNAILVDIGGKTTNITVISEGNVKKVKTFDIGGRTITKDLAKELNLKFSEAEDLKINYSSKQNQKDFLDKIKKVFNRDFSTIFSGIELSLGEFSDSGLLPFKILFYGGTSQILSENDMVDKSVLKKKLSFLSKTKSSFINISDISNIIDETKKAGNLQYVNSISLASFTFDLSTEEDLLNKILRDA